MIESYLDISPIFENHWTGIPIVTAEIARQAIDDRDISWHFVYDNILVQTDVVQEMLIRRSGGDYLANLNQQLWNGSVIERAKVTDASCIFPNVKALRRVFKKEALIVHDLSTLLTPEFHNQDTVSFHANRIRQDIESSDIVFCVSKATKGDVDAYFPQARTKTSVLPLGIRMDACTVSDWVASRCQVQYEPYICVLGTIEPRKNGRIVLELLKRHPDILERFRVVFVGRDGWKDEKAMLLAGLSESGIDARRILFTGFVSEEVKLKLLLNCSFCVYPSFFEGYGIPVAEAAALGKFVACSNSSSMPEVAPEMCFFFDPLEVSSLAQAIYRAEKASRLSRLDQMSYPDIQARLKARDWDRGYAAIRDWLVKEPSQ